MRGKFLFRRNTHDREGNYRKEFNGTFQNHVWSAYGHICHLLDSSRPMTLYEIMDEVRKDSTNYDNYPHDLKYCFDSGPMPTPEQVSLGLVRLLEAGFVEMVPNEN